MRTLHIIRTLELQTGGPVYALEQMLRALNTTGILADVATTVPANRDDTVRRLALPDTCSTTLFRFPRHIDTTWSFSLPLRRWLRRELPGYDVIHIHGVFTFPSFVAAREARRLKIPYVLRPAGTLDTYSLGRKALRKGLYFRLFIRSMLDHAAVIHTTSESERRQVGELGILRRSVVIPHSIDLTAVERVPRQFDGPMRLLFLSRIHPKKGIPILLDALSIVRQKGLPVILKIAGNGSSEYNQQLRKMVVALNLSRDVEFVGFADNDVKKDLLAQSDLFVLPSFQENFGIAVAEAMSVGLPVIISDQVALADDVARNDAGIVVPINAPGAVAKAIEDLYDDQTRAAMGCNARAFAERNFSLETLATRLEELYRDVVTDYAET